MIGKIQFLPNWRFL